MNVVFVGVVIFIDPFVFERYFYLEGLGEDKVIQDQGRKRKDKGTDKIGAHDPPEAGSAAEDGDELCLLRHL
jgi:hypothetical protein